MKPPISDRINDALGLAPFEESVDAMIPTPEVSEEIAPVCEASGDPNIDADADLQHARTNLRSVLEKAQEAVDSNLSFAQQSDNPKAYEALAQIIAATVSASTALMTVNKTRQDIRSKTEKAAGPAQVNNTAIMLTTHDLLRMVRDGADIIDAVSEEI